MRTPFVGVSDTHKVGVSDTTGTATISVELAGIFNRLGTSASSSRARLEKLRTRRLFGRFFAASRERLREAAARLKVRRVGNQAGCPAV